MTDRQKFWLRVALTATFPIWILPAMALFVLGASVYLICLSVWEAVGEMLGIKPRHVVRKRAP